MPELLQNKDGSTNWNAIFMGFAAALVLIMQQWQTYKIAEIKTQAEVNSVNFLSKDKVLQIEQDIINRVDKIENRLDVLEAKISSRNP